MSFSRRLTATASLADGGGWRGIYFAHGAQRHADVKKFIKPAELLGWVDQTSLKSDI